MLWPLKDALTCPVITSEPSKFLTFHVGLAQQSVIPNFSACSFHIHHKESLNKGFFLKTEQSQQKEVVFEQG